MAHILVVDDEESVRDFLQMMLEGEGFEVTTAEDGAQALEKVATNPPDLILLDLMMPVLDGYGVLERLAGKRPPVVVILSAKANKEEAIRAGAFDGIAKPFDIGELLAACRKALQSAG